MFIKIDQNIFGKQNDYLIGVVTAENIDNAADNKGIEDFMNSVLLEQKQSIEILTAEGRTVKDLQEFKPYHEAMKNFGINLSRNQMSVEALLKRVSKAGSLPSISPVVDLANAISLKHHVPIGAHDIDSLVGDLEIRFVKSDDIFEDPDNSPGFDNEEVVYASGNSVRTRRWIWRQMQVGLLSKDSKNLVFPIDGFSGNAETILAARQDLTSHLERFFSCKTRVGFINKNRPAFRISGFRDDDEDRTATLTVEEEIKIILKEPAPQSEKATTVEKITQANEEQTDLDYAANDNESPGLALISSMEKNGLSKTRSEARRLIQQGAVKLNGEKITDINNIQVINDGDTLQIGKGKFFRIRKSNGG